MKSLKKVVTLAMMVIMVAGLTACSKKTAISSADFEDIMEAKGYGINDVTGQIAPEHITSILLAVDEDEEYQIEFYEFADTASANAVFAENKAIFEGYASDSSAEITKDIMNYSYYSVLSNGIYYVLAKIDDTMIYVVADDEYREEIKEIVKELGY